MPDDSDIARNRLSRLSGATRRMLDYVAILESAARYTILRHLARVSEEDMVDDLREAVESGIIAAVEGQPNTYAFISSAVRDIVLADIGEARLPKLRARAQGARRRVLGERHIQP